MSDGTDLRSQFLLDESVTFLNHGSFGACPRAVLEKQAELRLRLEREPVLFLARELEKMLDAARGELGAFVGADPDDLAFVKNASTGVSTVVASLDLQPGDELLTTSHAYNACHNALRAQERQLLRRSRLRLRHRFHLVFQGLGRHRRRTVAVATGLSRNRPE